MDLISRCQRRIQVIKNGKSDAKQRMRTVNVRPKTIVYNMGNIFLEKSYTKVGEKTSPKSFSKKSKLSITLEQKCKILYRLFGLYFQVKDYQNILKLRC